MDFADCYDALGDQLDNRSAIPLFIGRLSQVVGKAQGQIDHRRQGKFEHKHREIRLVPTVDAMHSADWAYLKIVGPIATLELPREGFNFVSIIAARSPEYRTPIDPWRIGEPVLGYLPGAI